MSAQHTVRIRTIPYRLSCFEDVTKRIDLFQLEQHLARSMHRTEVTQVPQAPPDDDFDTRVTMPREAVLPPPTVYPIKRRDLTDVLVVVLLATISGILFVMI